MSDDARIAHLIEIARERSLVYGSTPRHTLDAIEAALCVLAGEPPQWAVDLAISWRTEATALFGGSVADALDRCADDLLAAAKGKP